MYYVNGVGVDFKDNQYEIYLQLINFKDIAKSETPYVPEAPAEIGYAIGKLWRKLFMNYIVPLIKKYFGDI